MNGKGSTNIRIPNMTEAAKIEKEVGNKRKIEESSQRSGLFDKRLVLNVAEVAAVLGRTPRAIYCLVDKKKIPSRKLGGRRVFIPEEIEKWLRKAKAT